MHEEGWSRERAEAVLDSPERASTQDPGRLWQRLDLRRGETVADVGAGTGFYAFPAGEVVGPTGRVYAIDVSDELIELLAERVAARRASAVVPVRSTASKIPLASEVADVVLLANLLHGVPPSTVDEAIRLLRPGGRFANVDWKKQETPMGPPVEHRLTSAQAIEVLTRHGLDYREEFEVGPYHYAVVFSKPGRS